MEVLVGGEALGNQLGADDRAILELDEASRSFVRKDHSGDASDEQWITQAQQNRGNDGKENGSLPHGMHSKSPWGRMRPPCLCRV